MSFSGAARELRVTTSAVSQQIKTLEDYLGVTLFHRHRVHGLTLTAAGRICAPSLSAILDSLSLLFEHVRIRHETLPVTLLLSPSLLSTWLVPRLPDFRDKYPHIDLRLWLNRELQPTPEQTEHDLAIYYGAGPYEDVRIDALMSDSIYPVCSPQLLARQRIDSPGDLRSHVLIHDDTMIWNRESAQLQFPDWPAWLTFAGVTGLDSLRGIRIQGSSLALDAAAAGAGVALARSCIAAPYLADGRLVRPLAIEYPRRFNYKLVSAPLALAQPAVACVHAWLLEEGRKLMAATSGPIENL